MSNQTIDGVPRETVEITRDLAERLTEGWNGVNARIELRKMLDAPAVESELDRLRAENERLLAGFYQQVTDADIKKISDYMGDRKMPTGAFLRQDAYDLANMTTHMCREVQALRNKLAAQHQGEPVAVTLQQVLAAYEYAESHPHKYLRGTTNWCAAVAHKLNNNKGA